MKAAIYTKYGPPEVFQLKDVQKPVPKENEVLIRIHTTTVTAVDYIFRGGKDFSARMYTGIFKPKRQVLGGELAGEIEAVGNKVKNFEIGDKVFGSTTEGFGAYAEYICLSEDGPLVLIPATMRYEEATAISGGGLTALPFLRDHANIRSGQKILINGASGTVGTFAVQLAKYYGAEVTAVCSTSSVEMARYIGADKVIDYKKTDFTKTKETYNIIFDVVGMSSFSRCKHLLTPNGIYLTTVITPAILIQMPWTSKFGKKKAIIAFTGLRKPQEKLKDLLFLKELIEQGKIKPVVDKVYPIEQIADAHQFAEAGHKKGSVVLTV